jgi:predicted transcriptional regulator
MAGESDLRVLVAQVAAAYFSNSHVRPSEISDVVSQITASLRRVEEDDRRGTDMDALSAPGLTAINASDGTDDTRAAIVQPTAAVIRRSIHDDGLISFEDGRSYRTLKRHLTTRGLTPAQYRDKWGLPHDYPMVCADSSARRSALAKQIGLGRKHAPRRRKATPSET